MGRISTKLKRRNQYFDILACVEKLMLGAYEDDCESLLKFAGMIQISLIYSLSIYSIGYFDIFTEAFFFPYFLGLSLYLLCTPYKETALQTIDFPFT